MLTTAKLIVILIFFYGYTVHAYMNSNHSFLTKFWEFPLHNHRSIAAPMRKRYPLTCLTLHTHSTQRTQTNEIVGIWFFGYTLPSIAILWFAGLVYFTISPLIVRCAITFVIEYIAVNFCAFSVILARHSLAGWHITLIDVEPIFSI